MPLRHERLADTDSTKLRADVIAALRRGELCALPTETVYGLAALPSHPDVQAKLEALAELAPDGPQQQRILHLADQSDLDDLDVTIPLPAKRLMERYWPGPLTLRLPRDSKAGPPLLVRLPAHEFTRSIVREIGDPLWLESVPTPPAKGSTSDGGGPQPLADPDAVAASCAEHASILVDDGQSPLGNASTIVDAASGGELLMLREGILSRAEVLHTAADLIVFVCTGNTCRSPLAEALAREATAAAMGVDSDRVLARGLAFQSAGTATVAGMPVSDGSRDAGAEIGLDMSAHESQPMHAELWQRALHIYCLSNSHREALLAEAPEAARKIQLLRPDGLDIADPYGGDLDIYRRARDEIRNAVNKRMGDWWP
ncbi:MAG: Sua5/YciO/YrdC/YwlC family protein [Planctomycetota bacterium]